MYKQSEGQFIQSMGKTILESSKKALRFESLHTKNAFPCLLAIHCQLDPWMLKVNEKDCRC